MNCEEFQNQVLDLFYGESSVEARHAGVLHRASCESCEREWRLLEAVEQRFAKWSVQEVPTHLSLSLRAKINAERRQKSVKRIFSSTAWGVLTTLVFVAFGFYFGADLQEKPQRVQDSSLAYEPLLRSEPRWSPLQSKSKHLLYPSLTAVSTQSDTDQFGSIHFDFDDVLDQKIISRNLSPNDLTALFFRARNLEKLEYYQEALHDYEFLAHFEPDFENIKAVQLAIARCLANLGEKDKAIEYLEKWSKEYPEETRPLLDQLKSEIL